MRYTLQEFKIEYPDDDACLEAVFQNRYGDIQICPKCGVVKPTFYRVKKRPCYACKDCGHHLYPLADTIFRKTKTPLWSWFYGIYLFSVGKNGVSAKELERHLGVTYKTAWRMCKQIRLLMAEELGELDGTVEMDETYIGGRHHRRYGYTKKAAVFGMVERGGRIKAKHVRSSGARVLLPEIEQGVSRSAQIYTDDYGSYKSLTRRGYKHDTVNHSKREYARELVCTNTIEGFWSQLKRSIGGTYHYVSPKYLQHYVDEFVFRYNYRTTAVCPVLLARVGKPVLLIS